MVKNIVKLAHMEWRAKIEAYANGVDMVGYRESGQFGWSRLDIDNTADGVRIGFTPTDGPHYEDAFPSHLHGAYRLGKLFGTYDFNTGNGTFFFPVI